jgi:hypothetical protein
MVGALAIAFARIGQRRRSRREHHDEGRHHSNGYLPPQTRSYTLHLFVRLLYREGGTRQPRPISADTPTLARGDEFLANFRERDF